MTPAQIKRLRERLGESRAEFAQRFHRSLRTVEAWEVGRRTPDAFVVSTLKEISRELKKSLDAVTTRA